MSEDFRETLYTIDKRGKRKWVYAALAKGRWHSRRAIIAYALMVIYLALPWLTIDGKQAVLFDLAERKFIFFGATYWATDTLPLVFLLGFLALCLFFFTALFGRVWCGWACPETIFLEWLFRPIERWIEGGPVARQKLDEAPWNAEKIRKKLVKHLLNAFFAWLIATAALAYFFGAEQMIAMMTDWPTNNLFPFILTVVLMGAMAFQFGWFREQFCTIMCPYARFQSVLMDPNSLVVGYDPNRGEPRGRFQRDPEKAKAFGDCIDCGMCVKVCPTGIDIRNGLQLECIACTQCIDACDTVMRKIDRPEGLIRYDTETRLSGEKMSLLRPRVVVYGLILLLYIGAFSYVLANRSLSEFQILRGARDAPFAMISSDRAVNHLHVRVSNKSYEEVQYEFVPLEDERIRLVTPITPFTVAAEEIKTVPLFVQFPVEVLQDGRYPLRVSLRGGDGFEGSQEITLLGPDKE